MLGSTHCKLGDPFNYFELVFYTFFLISIPALSFLVMGCDCQALRLQQYASVVAPATAVTEPTSRYQAQDTSLQVDQFFRHRFRLISATLNKYNWATVCRDIYCAFRSFFPPPLFQIHFFPPTNKFAAGGAIFFEIIAQKDSFLRPIPPLLM